MKVLKTIINVFIWIVIVFISLLALLNVYFLISEKINKNSTLFGYSYQVGLNYSMKPTLMPNDFLITHKQNKYELNDIVTFIDNDSGRVTTHRIIEITENGYITKGDSLAVTEDAEITNKNIIGKVVVVVHNIGGVLRIAKTPYGILILIAIIVVCGFIIKALLEKNDENLSQKGEK